MSSQTISDQQQAMMVRSFIDIVMTVVCDKCIATVRRQLVVSAEVDRADPLIFASELYKWGWRTDGKRILCPSCDAI